MFSGGNCASSNYYRNAGEQQDSASSLIAVTDFDVKEDSKLRE